MSLYGFPREPEAADDEAADALPVPHPRVASEPVAVPGAASAVPTFPPFPRDLPSDPPAFEAGAFEPPPFDPATFGPTSQGSHAYGAPSSFDPASFGSSALDAPSTEPPAFDSPAFDPTLAARPVLSHEARDEPSSGTPSSGNGVYRTATTVTEGSRHAASGDWAPAPTHAAADPGPMLDDLDDQVDAALEEEAIAPWDRKPLMVVIAAAAALVLLAILSGVASAAMFPPEKPPVQWRDAEPAPSASGAAPGGSVPIPVNDTITLSGVGDVIMGSSPNTLPPQNGAGFFDPVKAALASDLVMGNLETPLTDNTGVGKCGPGPSSDCFQFYLPPSYANHLRDGGFQVLNLANNHTNDMGAQGLANTRDALTAAGIQSTGGVGQITYTTVKGVKVAVLGFSVYSWGANLNNIEASVALVKEAAAQAEIVVIQMQGGAEGSDKTHVRTGHENFLGEDRGDLLTFSHAVIDAGADVIFGHGPHIMRGMEFYKGRLIAYSLGNFCGYKVLGTAGFLGVGGVLKVTLHKDGSWASGKLVSTEMINSGIAYPDDDQRALAFVAGLSKEDFGANAATISLTDGAIAPPAT